MFFFPKAVEQIVGGSTMEKIQLPEVPEKLELGLDLSGTLVSCPGSL